MKITSASNKTGVSFSPESPPERGPESPLECDFGGSAIPPASTSPVDGESQTQTMAKSRPIYSNGAPHRPRPKGVIIGLVCLLLNSVVFAQTDPAPPAPLEEIRHVPSSDGPIEVKGPTGELRAQLSLKKGMPDGPFVTWREGGKKALEATFRAGLPDGIWTLYDTSGQRETQLVFERGFLNGPVLAWYSDGALAFAGWYIDGAAAGFWSELHPNGKVKRRGTWAQGLRIGLWRLRKGSGVLEAEAVFRDGLLIRGPAVAPVEWNKEPLQTLLEPNLARILAQTTGQRFNSGRCALVPQEGLCSFPSVMETQDGPGWWETNVCIMGAPSCNALLSAGERLLSASSAPGISADVYRAASIACTGGAPEACDLAARASRPVVPSVPLERVSGFYQHACDIDFAGVTGNSSCLALGRLLNAGMVSSDEEVAEQLFERSCGAGFGEGCFSAAVVAAGAQPPRADAALNGYEQACTLGYAPGCFNLALMLERGDGRAQNDARAVSLLKQACDSRVAEGCHALGLRLRDGRGIDADPSLARAVLGTGCELGLQKACRVQAALP